MGAWGPPVMSGSVTKLKSSFTVMTFRIPLFLGTGGRRGGYPYVYRRVLVRNRRTGPRCTCLRAPDRERRGKLIPPGHGTLGYYTGYQGCCTGY